MAIITEPRYYEDSMAGKMQFVFDKLKYQYPDIRIQVNANPPGGDYSEFLFEGIGIIRLSNTEMVVKSPQEIATQFEAFIRRQYGYKEQPKRDVHKKLAELKQRKPLTAAEEFAEEWARKNK